MIYITIDNVLFIPLYTKTQKRVYSDHTFAKHSNVSFSKIMNAFKWGNQSLKTDIEYLGGKNIIIAGPSGSF